MSYRDAQTHRDVNWSTGLFGGGATQPQGIYNTYYIDSCLGTSPSDSVNWFTAINP